MYENSLPALSTVLLPWEEMQKGLKGGTLDFCYPRWDRKESWFASRPAADQGVPLVLSWWTDTAQAPLFIVGHRERKCWGWRDAENLHLPPSSSTNMSRGVWRELLHVFSLQPKYIHQLDTFLAKFWTQRIELYNCNTLLIFASSVLRKVCPILLNNQRNLWICEDHDRSLSNVVHTCPMSTCGAASR